MATILKDGLIADLTATTVPEGDVAMFQEVVEQLAPHHRVRLDTRRFTEVSINGAGWTYNNDASMQHFALRLTAGRAVFDCGFGHNNRVDLKAGNWLYVPLLSDFRVTTRRGDNDYPCVFVVAQLIVE